VRFDATGNKYLESAFSRSCAGSETFIVARIVSHGAPTTREYLLGSPTINRRYVVSDNSPRWYVGDGVSAIIVSENTTTLGWQIYHAKFAAAGAGVARRQGIARGTGTSGRVIDPGGLTVCGPGSGAGAGFGVEADVAAVLDYDVALSDLEVEHNLRFLERLCRTMLGSDLGDATRTGLVVESWSDDLGIVGANPATWANRARGDLPLAQGVALRQGTVTANGPGGRKAVLFDTASKGMAVSFTAAQPFTYIFTFRETAHTNPFGYVWDSATVDRAILYSNTPGGSTSMYAGATITTAGYLVNGVFGTVCAIYNGATSYIYQNGQLFAGPINVGANSTDGLTISCRAAWIFGEPSEWMGVLVYSRLLSDAERLWNTNVARDKCGLSY
jgi:hypothetical protein